MASLPRTRSASSRHGMPRPTTATSPRRGPMTMSTSGSISPTRRTPRASNYCPDLAGNIRHAKILDIGSAVEQRVDRRYLEKQQVAVKAGVELERAAGQARLETALDLARDHANARLREALADAAEQHRQRITELVRQRDAQEADAVARTAARCLAEKEAALEAARLAALDRLGRELRLCTIEVTKTVTADMLSKQHVAVDRAERAADAKHARELALNNKRLHRNFEAEAAQLRTKHGKEITAVEARLAAEQDTGAELQRAIDNLGAELVAATDRHRQLIADYRRTLSVHLPNYDAKHSFLI